MIPRFSIRRLKERLRTNTISQYIPPELQFLPPLRIEDNRILFDGYVDRRIRMATLIPNIDESLMVDQRYGMRNFFKTRGGERFVFLYNEYPPTARIIEGTFEVDYKMASSIENGFTYLARTLQHARQGKLLLIPLVGGDELNVVLA